MLKNYPSSHVIATQADRKNNIPSIIINRKFYDLYEEGVWYYTVHGCDGNRYYSIENHQLELMASWTKPYKINH